MILPENDPAQWPYLVVTGRAYWDKKPASLPFHGLTREEAVRAYVEAMVLRRTEAKAHRMSDSDLLALAAQVEVTQVEGSIRPLLGVVP